MAAVVAVVAAAVDAATAGSLRPWDQVQNRSEPVGDETGYPPSTFIDAHATKPMMRIKGGEKSVDTLRSEWLQDGEDESIACSSGTESVEVGPVSSV